MARCPSTRFIWTAKSRATPVNARPITPNPDPNIVGRKLEAASAKAAKVAPGVRPAAGERSCHRTQRADQSEQPDLRLAEVIVPGQLDRHCGPEQAEDGEQGRL